MVIFFAILTTASAMAIGLLFWRWQDKRKERSAWVSLVQIAGYPQDLFDPAMIRDLPELVQRYFLFTISPGAPLPGAVEIEMTGELGLGSKDTPDYRAMRAEEILAPPHGLVWRLEAGPINGSDGITPSTSWTRFWLFGLVPVVRVGGTSDHHRSAFARVISEGAFWVPSSLLPSRNVVWEATDEATARAIVTYGEERQAVDISIDDDGRPTRIIVQRWSNANPEKEFKYQPFGGYLSKFKDFDGYQLPTRVEGGNFIGTDCYFPFFKAEVTDIRITAG